MAEVNFTFESAQERALFWQTLGRPDPGTGPTDEDLRSALEKSPDLFAQPEQAPLTDRIRRHLGLEGPVGVPGMGSIAAHDTSPVSADIPAAPVPAFERIPGTEPGPQLSLAPTPAMLKLRDGLDGMLAGEGIAPFDLPRIRDWVMAQDPADPASSVIESSDGGRKVRYAYRQTKQGVIIFRLENGEELTAAFVKTETPSKPWSKGHLILAIDSVVFVAIHQVTGRHAALLYPNQQMMMTVIGLDGEGLSAAFHIDGGSFFSASLVEAAGTELGALKIGGRKFLHFQTSDHKVSLLFTVLPSGQVGVTLLGGKGTTLFNELRTLPSSEIGSLSVREKSYRGRQRGGGELIAVLTVPRHLLARYGKKFDRVFFPISPDGVVRMKNERYRMEWMGYLHVERTDLDHGGDSWDLNPDPLFAETVGPPATASGDPRSAKPPELLSREWFQSLPPDHPSVRYQTDGTEPPKKYVFIDFPEAKLFMIIREKEDHELESVVSGQN